MHSDLRERKKTYPVLAALGRDDRRSAELAGILDSPVPLDEAGALRAAALVEACGGRDATLEEARHHLDAARVCLRSASLAPRAAGEIEVLLGFLLRRRM
ncbi:geranylgeranyl pyrophosphate synthase [Streptomyces griseus]